MKNYILFWAVLCIVVVPVILGLMVDLVTYNLFAVCYAAVWWIIFNKTKEGRKVFRKGYKIACSIMGDCDI